MSEIVFKYQGFDTPINFTPDEKMRVIIKRFCFKINKNKNLLRFIFENEIVDEESTVEKLLSNKDNNIFIIVLENDEIRIKYKKEKQKEKIKIFGSSFVQRNVNMCKIKYNEKEYKLTEKLNIEEDKENKEEIEIILKGIDNITKLNEMFEDCSSLIEFSNWNPPLVTNMSCMFSGCKSLKFLPDLSNWNTSAVTDMRSMFRYCSRLESLPDLSKWDTSNVNNMYEMFYDCKSLKFLPDISKWNTSKVKFIDGMFCGCSSLLYLPDISKWNTSKVISIDSLFRGCSSLSSLPDISNWNLGYCSMKRMFSGCSSLISLPDISKFNEGGDVDNLFGGCISLVTIPDITKFTAKNVDYLFNECISLVSSLPCIEEHEETYWHEPTEWGALSGERSYEVKEYWYTFKKTE